MKLRVSYGTMGNQSIGSYYPYVAAVNSLSGTVNYWFDKKLTTGIAQAQLANELITWEKSKQFDVGLDLTLFKSRLSLTADYYIRNISGMLQQFDLPDFVGMSAPWQNAGSMRNNGWEVSIGWQDKIGDLSYYVKANLSDVKNTVTNLYGKNMIRRRRLRERKHLDRTTVMSPTVISKVRKKSIWPIACMEEQSEYQTGLYTLCRCKSRW